MRLDLAQKNDSNIVSFKFSPQPSWRGALEEVDSSSDPLISPTPLITESAREERKNVEDIVLLFLTQKTTEGAKKNRAHSIPRIINDKYENYRAKRTVFRIPG